MAYFRQHQGLGRPLKWELGEIINPILYVMTTGCQWSILPHDFSP